MRWFRRWCREKSVSQTKLKDGNFEATVSSTTSLSAGQQSSDDEAFRQNIRTAVVVDSDCHRLMTKNQDTKPIEATKTTISESITTTAESCRANTSKRLHDKNCTDSSAIERVNYASSTSGNGDGETSAVYSLRTHRTSLIACGDSKRSTGLSDCDSDFGDGACCIGYSSTSLTATLPSVRSSQQNLERQARQLENFISDFDESDTDEDFARRTRSQTRPHALNKDDLLSEWVVVTIESSAESLCERGTSTTASSSSTSDHTFQYYSQLSKVNRRDINDNILIGKISPSDSTLIDQNSSTFADAFDAEDGEQDYGLFHSRHSTAQRILRIFKFLDFKIKTGRRPIESTNLNLRTHEWITVDDCDSVKVPRDPSSSKATMTMKTELLTSTWLAGDHCRLSSFSTTPQEPKRMPTMAELFGLNDYGDFILCVDHIPEEKGFGFLMRRNKEIYHKCSIAKEIKEANHITWMTLKQIWYDFVDAFYDKCRGEF